ncbi:hypothetical protein [uncultured Neptuniibacter sp.]|uniref:hypothetical protein n=1 Tax=uncultured Neptuniibacter sp. TaxID=502143 RepID=UPI00262C06EF|nr:hypothetical protein [uncultured Neptuniibacter sp.]
MRFTLILTLLLQLAPVAAFADSLSITLKPAKKLAGTTSITLHAEGHATLLIYKSPTQINETPLKLTSTERNALHNDAISLLRSYMQREDHLVYPRYPFTLAITHTATEVTKSISASRLSPEALTLLRTITALLPEESIGYIRSEI